MFFYQAIPLTTWLMALGVVAALVLLNEVTRRSKWAAVAAFIVLPIVLTIFVWPKTAGAGTSADGNWFAWVKPYSALAGVIGFMAIRYFKKLDGSKFMFLFPPIILAVNILEAVYRDYEVFANFNGVTEVVNGLTMMGGPWNLLNAIAGIISIITITGWAGIKIAKTKSRDMVWPDMLWFYIIAYDLWNFAYCYNCISDRSFYAGFLLLASASIAAFCIKKGPWLQHRAQTLALFAMFHLTVPTFAESSQFAVKISGGTTPMYVMSILSLAANAAVLVYMLVSMKKRKTGNPYKNDVYAHLKSYQAVLEANNLKD